MKTIFSQMLEIIKQNPSLLIRYAEDLYIDGQILDKVDDSFKFVWILRENGTHLLNLKDLSTAGLVQRIHNSHPEAIYYIGKVENSRKSGAVTYTTGTLIPILHQELLEKLQTSYSESIDNQN